MLDSGDSKELAKYFGCPSIQGETTLEREKITDLLEKGKIIEPTDYQKTKKSSE